MLNLYPNQKAIRISKQTSNKDNPYSIFNSEALKKAMKLPPIPFKLWAYINANTDGYEFGLSATEICQALNISKSSYHGAVNKLIEEKYLIKQELYPNLEGYIFYEGGNN